MKKTLVALAALAAGGAFAQSTVTIFGAVDASYNYATADLAPVVAGGASHNETLQYMGTSQLGSSKLGFQGREDLGGGLFAKFWLEAGLNNDSGAGKATNTNNGTGATATGGLTFQRRSYVGLVGNWGEVQLGRQYVNTFLGVQAAVDPFGTNGPADSTQMMLALAGAGKSKTAVNASNMFGYITPDMSGFSANLQMFMGEQVSGTANPDDGGGYSITGQYAKGPFFGSIGQQNTKYKATGDYTLTAASLSYDFGMAKIVYTYADEKSAAAVAVPEAKNTSNLFGIIFPYGAFNFKGSYITATNNIQGGDKKGELFGVGVDYALSKRSILYATYGSIKNHDGGSVYGAGVIGALAADGGTTNLAIGMYHAF